jgi:hypothetical protein
MGYRYLQQRVVAMAMGIGLFAAVVGAALAAELAPYSLPSQQRPVVPDARVLQEPRPARPTVNEAYYEQFAARARALTPGQRSELQKSFTQKRDLALKNGRVDEAQHYSRLVQIVVASQ